MKVARWWSLVLTVWAPLATAKLPAAVQTGFKDLYLVVGVFFGFVLAFSAAGVFAARKAAPKSRDTRQFIFAVATFLGVALGGYFALKVAR
jgi:hypothetical protein